MGSILETAVMLLLLFSGLYLTARMRGRHLLHPLTTLKTALSTLNRSSSSRSLTPFQAAAASLAGTMGTGNIAGVATAIALGGPGAVFWMLVGGITGMAVKYAEIVLGCGHLRRFPDGSCRGGPYYYLSDGGHPRLAIAFAGVCALSGLLTGNIIQVGAAAKALESCSSIPLSPWIPGLSLALGCFLLIQGGKNLVGRFSAGVIPLLSGIYLAGCAGIIFTQYRLLPVVLREIFTEAFSFRAVSGGCAGSGCLLAVRYGLARGVFSHEAGLGSAPIAHGSADPKDPHAQGCWGMIEVFLDTVVGCMATALVILISRHHPQWNTLASQFSGDTLASAAFSLWYGRAGEWFLTLSLVLFAAASLPSWWMYGSEGLEYLCPKGGRWYFLAYLAAAAVGGLLPAERMWELSDLLNCTMILINLPFVTCRFSPPTYGTKKLNTRKKANSSPMFSSFSSGNH